ncbi:hypothetical protein [Chroococcus sp. FPU101]|uniref:hypothetical protein n=1 Tax=Chroococcus sp. FPU101 TaxID=1974212 RepID=UPI001A8DB20C|nr:hypothetical protein [Chroococcus sp. FPU101]GFE71959.1 hypothetical protein CFPU101_45690 [Chroococcus sp. FPU101]
MSILVLFGLVEYGTIAHANGVFNNESIRGNYAVVTLNVGGQYPQAGISVINYDGKGKLSGTSIQNLPGASIAERILTKAVFSGTYIVNPDGTGQSVIKMSLPNGTTTDHNLAFVITKAKEDNIKQAERINLIQEQLDEKTGGLLKLEATKLPDDGTFTNASLKGQYAYTLSGYGGRVSQLGLGIMSYNGQGSFSGKAIVNLPGETTGKRIFVTAPFVRPYNINADGTGIATPPGESDILFIITEAQVDNGIKVGQSAFFIVNQINPITGNLLTGEMTKLPN